MNAPVVLFTAPRTVEEAQAIAGTLSTPGKMPCHSYSLPAVECKTGSALHKVEGSVCQHCYALKGNYRYPNVKDAMGRRFGSLRHPFWADAMVILIGRHRNQYFRWHDSGDIQDLDHLLRIVQVAERLPHIKFWLPTREVGIIKEFEREYGAFPKNLTVRVSGAMVDGPPPDFPVTSTVVSKNPTCPSWKQDNKCQNCRACWDPKIANISYRAH